MDLEQISNLASELVARAKRAGADAADAIVASNRSISVSARMGKLEEVDRSEGDGLGLRVFVGRKQASVSANQPDPGQFDELAERAVAMARVAPDDPYAGLADEALLARAWSVPDILDSREVDADELRKLAIAAEEAALGISGITNSNGASASAGRSGFVLATSSGFTGGYEGSSYSISCSPIAGSGTAMERDYDYATVRHFADLPPPSDIGVTAANRALARLHPKKVASGRYPVIYDWRAASSLVSHLLGAISGSAVARKTTFLLDKKGEHVFSPGISIVDDPLLARGLRSRPFDGEGMATRRHRLIDDGILTDWMLDAASARELGLTPTGHATRGVGGPPSPGASNVHLEPGAKSPRELLAEMGTGLLVTDLIGHGVNGVTGDYSRGAAGFWIEGGEIAYPVSEITIAGNLKDMFASLVPANDLVLRYSVNAPSILIERMTLAGT